MDVYHQGCVVFIGFSQYLSFVACVCVYHISKKVFVNNIKNFCNSFLFRIYLP